MPDANEEVYGRVVSKRMLSRKLVFFDLERGTTGKSIELLLKASDTLTASAVHDLRDAIKLGDEVAVTGCFEDSKVFIVSGIEVTQRWKDSHPGRRFDHRPVTYEAAPPPCEQHAGHTQQENGRQLCKFHLNGPGSCTRGAACPFLHADLGAACLRRNWIAERRQRRHQLAAGLGDPHAGNAQRKSQRAAIFSCWLLDTFGRHYLNQGSGVLDVAGGRGALSFCLQSVHGVRCTCIDPRPPALAKHARMHLRQLRKARGVPGATREPDSQQLPEELAGSPWDLLEEACWASTGDDAASAAQQQHGEAQQHARDGMLPDHIMAEFNADLWQGEHGGRLQEASLVVGLHPDQATDSVVDFAALHGKPFAVVPCCVFPRQFGHRRLHRSGTEQPAPVVDNSELVEWLVQLGGPGTQVQHLAFEGRNQVVFKPAQGIITQPSL